jgi:hypothetical protein
MEAESMPTDQEGSRSLRRRRPRKLGGRPTKYRSAYGDQARRYCQLGAVDADLARFFQVSERTINNWKHAHTGFLQSIRAGRVIADAEVARALYHRAIGFSHPEQLVFVHEGTITIVTTRKHYPPDVRAAAFWLRHRQRARWGR